METFTRYKPTSVMAVESCALLHSRTTFGLHGSFTLGEYLVHVTSELCTSRNCRERLNLI